MAICRLCLPKETILAQVRLLACPDPNVPLGSHARLHQIPGVKSEVAYGLVTLDGAMANSLGLFVFAPIGTSPAHSALLSNLAAARY